MKRLFSREWQFWSWRKLQCCEGFAGSHVGGELDGNSGLGNNGSSFGGDESYNDFDSYSINLQILES